MQGIILQPTLWERKKFLPAIIAYTLAVIAYTLGLKILPAKLYFYPGVDFSALGKEILPCNTPYLLVCMVCHAFQRIVYLFRDALYRDLPNTTATLRLNAISEIYLFIYLLVYPRWSCMVCHAFQRIVYLFRDALYRDLPNTTATLRLNAISEIYLFIYLIFSMVHK